MTLFAEYKAQLLVAAAAAAAAAADTFGSIGVTFFSAMKLLALSSHK